MTPALRAVYDELVERAARPPLDESARQHREAFFVRCGEAEPGKPRAEARDQAAWEDALVRGGLAAALARDLRDPSEREIAAGFARAQRGLFVFQIVKRHLLARDLWTRAEFIVHPQDDVGRELFAATQRADSPLCQARLLGTLDGCVFLPGAIFHPLDALTPIDQVLAVARQRGLDTDQVLDTLLTMENTWQTLSRVKVAYAYRASALPASPVQ